MQGNLERNERFVIMDKTTAINNVKHYASEVQKVFHPNAIVLFGSYVKGNASEESDIDIAVIFNGFNGDFLETSAQLWHLTCDIDDRIEPILLDSTKDKSGFVNEILKTGQVIYSAI